jgi:hypothetical protein
MVAFGILRDGYLSLLVEPPLSKAACTSCLPLEFDLVWNLLTSCFPGLILQMILIIFWVG